MTDDTNSSINTVNDKTETTNTVTNLLMISAINSHHNIPSWSGIRSLLSETRIPFMQVVTLYPSPSYCVLNCVHSNKKLCSTYCSVETKNLSLLLWRRLYCSWHLPEKLRWIQRPITYAKRVSYDQGCLTCYWRRSVLDDILKYTKTCGPKTLESVTAGTRYVQSLRWFRNLIISIQILKW